MIVYSASCENFIDQVRENQIEENILQVFQQRLGFRVSKSEIRSWRDSLRYMKDVLELASAPQDAQVAIEYRIPLTSKRVDFILAGSDERNQSAAIIVELKQWESVELTDKDAIVRTFLGGAVREVTHPSYQAWTYASLIQDFNVDVRRGNVGLYPCAYLHNCTSESVIKNRHYEEHLRRAPAFLKRDVLHLAEFISKFVKSGGRSKEALYAIDHGRIKPSKSLADHLVSLLSGNKEFEMIDDQKIVYESALSLAEVARSGRKQVLLVEGGPGTGKSVVAINLLVELTRRRLVAHYVTRNRAPRHVYQAKLTGVFSRTHIQNLFKSSGAYLDAAPNEIDVAIVDEAHRLNEKSGLYQNLGENQIQEIVAASRLSVFFLDEDQRVTLKDAGDKASIKAWAEECRASFTELKLESQFRCNGSDGYLAWVNHVLGVRETANKSLEGIDYDFRVCSTPNELHDLIRNYNTVSNKARLVAGYCWPWKGKKDPAIKDVVIPEHEFARRWNLDKDGPLWLIADESVEEVGCIHTCQGLELDYVGVIIGPDLIVRDGEVITDPSKRSSQDRSVHGIKKMLREDPERAHRLADRIIKNTYRTLMTRGQKGCFIYCVDPETNVYFSNFSLELGPVSFERAADFSGDRME